MYQPSLPDLPHWRRRFAEWLRLEAQRLRHEPVESGPDVEPQHAGSDAPERTEAEARLEFRSDGRRLGCLLVHGLTSTPRCMRPLAAELSRQGIDVQAILLPGHGTRPEDLQHVTWPDWYEAVRSGVQELRERCDRVFICGQSLGGTLALRAALHEPIDGVITLAAIAYLRDWRLKFLPALKPIMRWKNSRSNDIANRTVQDEGSYQRLPLHAIEQLVLLAEEVQEELPRLDIPALIVQSSIDHVAPVGNADLIYDRIGSEYKELVRLHNSYHVISLDNDRELVAERCVRFIRKIGYAQRSASA